MLMINMKRIALGLIAISIAASCSMSTKMDATLERDVESVTVLKETAKVPVTPSNDDIIRVKNDIWLGDRSEIEHEGRPIPTHLEAADGVTLISNRPISLFEIGDTLTKITGLKVRFAPEIEQDAISTAQANRPSLESINADWAEPNKMLVSYKGPLSGLLDEMSSRFGVWWKHEDREIHFYKYITRTFVIYSLPTNPSLSVTVGGQTSGSGGNAAISLTSSAEVALWSNIESTISGMIDSSGGARLTTDPANGTVTLTATPNDIRKVSRYVNEQNIRLSRQVAVSVKIFQVTVNDSDQYGLSFGALFSDGMRDVDGNIISGTTAGLVSAAGLSSEVANNLSMTIFPGNWDINAAIQAISKQGSASLVTSGTVTTLNNKPAPIQVVNKEKYISEYTKTNSGGTGNFYDISVETADLETGFTMDVLPRILEHGRLMLMFNLTLSDLLEMETMTIDPVTGQYIMNPKVESRGFTQEVAMKSGESLVLTGYERVATEASKTGVGSATNSLLGGTAVAAKTRVMLVVVLTPIVLESPLVPESRMNND